MTDDRVFYGPHPCGDCSKMIVRASHTQGGEEFDQPDGPVYPNTVWVRHDCSPKTQRGANRSWERIADTAAMNAGQTFPEAEPVGPPVSPLTADS